MNRLLKIGIFGLIVSSLISCKGNEEKYNLYPNEHIKIQDLYSFNGKYIVFCYGSWCPHCLKIQDTMVDFFEEIKNKNNCFDSFYLISFEKSSLEEGITEREMFKKKPGNYDPNNPQYLIDEMKENHINKVEDTYLFGFPQMYIIENNSFQDVIIGSSEIPEYISNLGK